MAVCAIEAFVLAAGYHSGSVRVIRTSVREGRLEVIGRRTGFARVVLSRSHSRRHALMKGRQSAVDGLPLVNSNTANSVQSLPEEFGEVPSTERSSW